MYKWGARVASSRTSPSNSQNLCCCFQALHGSVPPTPPPPPGSLNSGKAGLSLGTHPGLSRALYHFTGRQRLLSLALVLRFFWLSSAGDRPFWRLLLPASIKEWPVQSRWLFLFPMHILLCGPVLKRYSAWENGAVRSSSPKQSR